MRNLLISVVRWLRRPDVGQSPITIKEVLDLPYEPNTVGILLERMERDRTEHHNWADRLDRKLLAVITADGVYATFLVSFSNSIPSCVVTLVVLILAVSFILAYLAWRPHPYGSVLLNCEMMNILPDDLSRILIGVHSVVNPDMGKINQWKAEKLTWSAWVFAAAALVTLSVYTVAI